MAESEYTLTISYLSFAKKKLEHVKAKASSIDTLLTVVFSNMTLIGPLQTPTTQYNTAFKRGAHIRRNSRESVFNSIMMGWPTGVKVEGDSCHMAADSNWLVFNNNVIAACTQLADSSAATNVWNITPWLTATASNNTVYANNSDVMLTSPFNYYGPDFRPTSSSPVLTGASFTSPKLAIGFTTVNYRGAFGTDDWTAGWTNFNPDTSSYTMGIYPTSTTHRLLADQINVYPNPVKDQSSVTLSYSAKENTQVEWELMTITGTVVSKGNYTQHSGNNAVYIPVNHIENGLFFLQLKTTQETKSIKLTCIK